MSRYAFDAGTAKPVKWSTPIGSPITSARAEELRADWQATTQRRLDRASVNQLVEWTTTFHPELCEPVPRSA